MNKWHYDARVSGDIAALQQKWFGYTFDDFSAANPETMSISAGVKEYPVWTEITEDGSWVGFTADVAEAVKSQAEADGVALTIDVDTANPLNDYTWNGGAYIRASVDSDVCSSTCSKYVISPTSLNHCFDPQLSRLCHPVAPENLAMTFSLPAIPKGPSVLSW